MSEEAKWQDLSIELALNAKKNLDAKDDEIDRLKAQLKETEAKGRVLMDMCRDFKRRVAEYEEEMELFTAAAVMICQQESDEWDSDSLQTYKDYAEVCGQRIAKLTPANARAWLLRKQAEAVEAFAEDEGRRWPTTLARGLVAAAKQYAQSLRQQANEAEKAGGEHG